MTSAVAKKKNTISMYANVLSMMNCCLSLYVCFVNFIEKMRKGIKPSSFSTPLVLNTQFLELDVNINVGGKVTFVHESVAR